MNENIPTLHIVDKGQWLGKVFCYGSDCKVCLTRQSDRLQAENANATEAISDFDLVTTVAQCGATTW